MPGPYPILLSRGYPLYRRYPVSILAMVVLLGIIIVEWLVLVLLNREVINHVQWPIAASFGLFKLLWPQNPGEALRILLSQPLLAVGHTEGTFSTLTWAIYYHPATLAQHIVAALLTALNLQFHGRWPWRQGLLLAGVWCAVFPAIYLIVASHCAVPTWALEVLLRELESPFGAGIDLQRYLPENITVFLTTTRAVLTAAGLLMLAYPKLSSVIRRYRR